jgi:hypothetical protein
LSAEKTPSLFGTIPAFQALIAKLQEYRDKHDRVAGIITAGITKLNDYLEETEIVPAYVLAISE